MDRRELLRRLGRNPHNVRFGDFIGLIEGFGFHLARSRGSHHIFSHPLVPHLVNVQEFKGQAKAYQVRQFLKLVERYNLRLEVEE
jgi:predicted RNA binding protein YcfA (HicA-like mRNA interferase family)